MNQINTITRPRHDFRIWPSSDGQYYFVYYDGNYQALVTSETYKTLPIARQALANFISEMGKYYQK
jgi:uncharacterized protein YegP (UPF0339 family)